MTSAYLAISFLKQTSLSEKQLRIIFILFTKNHLKNICYNAHIYKGKTNMSKHDLIDMVITEKNKKNDICTRR